MKHYFLTGLLFLSAGFAQAQDSLEQAANKAKWTSKRGVYIFPEKGEWALGFSGVPLLAYAGSLFSGQTLVPTLNYAGSPVNIMNSWTPAVFGKYMLRDNRAIRGRFQWASFRNSNEYIVPKALVTPDPFAPEFVKDKVISNGNLILLSGGYEWRRGKGRIKGVYGGEAVIGYGDFKTSTEYGNPMSADFPAPPTYAGNQTTRLLRNKTSTRVYGGVRAFAGMEYFFVPKLSLGAEFGYNLGFSWSSPGSTTYERFDTASGTSRQYSQGSNSFTGNGFGSGLDHATAGLNFCFYF